ncbi:MAG: dTDP-4-dehydrorhamnose 3,5-epimerase [Hyphomicrobiaceae bacterium]|nr:dTDP-4-dehydrorhamnose 3,5-epimerase [Hyphomicrobiaceae bacterium]
MQVRDLGLAGVREIIPTRIGDSRGYFSEVWNAARFAAAGLPTTWVQDNQSLSGAAGTVRGLHYQKPPFAQVKLVRVLTGAIRDVVVDIRHGSPTFGQWLSLEVSAAAMNQILVPEGFAHGFVSLQPETLVLIKVTAHYSAEHDRVVLWSDPAIGIDWGLDGAEPILSAKDMVAPMLCDVDTGFRYMGGTS